MIFLFYFWPKRKNIKYAKLHTRCECLCIFCVVAPSQLVDSNMLKTFLFYATAVVSAVAVVVVVVVNVLIKSNRINVCNHTYEISQLMATDSVWMCWKNNTHTVSKIHARFVRFSSYFCIQQTRAKQKNTRINKQTKKNIPKKHNK